jgi:hypothetical protein
MKRICAWCGEDLGEAESGQQEQWVITHGICRNCAYHLFAQTGMPLLEYLDGLGVSIVVVDAQGVVQTANEPARALLQKDLPEIEGYKGGDVFECQYAKLPEGCGHTVHCSGCAIRRTVMSTFHTGQNRSRVPACLNREASDGIHETQFLISTEKVGDVVLLRIDAVVDTSFDGQGGSCEKLS